MARTLIVFLNAGAGAWFPNSVARQLPNPLYFETVRVVGLQGVEDGDYVYGVINLNVDGGNAPAFHVRIKKDFDTWEVTRMQ